MSAVNRQPASTASGLSPFTPCFDNVVEAVTQEVLAGRESARGGCAAHTTTLVFGLIWRNSQKHYKVCFAKQTTMANELGISVRTFRKHIRRLEELGYIVDTTPDLRNRSHCYRITEKGYALLEQTQKTHRQKLPEDSSVKVTDEETEESFKQQQDIPMTLQPETKGALYLFECLHEEYLAAGREPPAQFNSLAQKRLFEETEQRLNGTIALAIDRALATVQPLDLRSVVSYVRLWEPPEPEKAPKPKALTLVQEIVALQAALSDPDDPNDKPSPDELPAALPEKPPIPPPQTRPGPKPPPDSGPETKEEQLWPETLVWLVIHRGTIPSLFDDSYLANVTRTKTCTRYTVAVKDKQTADCLNRQWQRPVVHAPTALTSQPSPQIEVNFVAGAPHPALPIIPLSASRH
jgi:DNA-binding MarR family transcriptional regulator